MIGVLGRSVGVPHVSPVLRHGKVGKVTTARAACLLDGNAEAVHTRWVCIWLEGETANGHIVALNTVTCPCRRGKTSNRAAGLDSAISIEKYYWHSGVYLA
jgi:hypothetical protein